MKYYIIAGEASGDLHAGNLIKQLKLIDPQAEFRGFGGDKMAESGAHITMHYRNMAFMGAFEVLANLSKIRKNFKICRSDILEYKPNAVILVDYAGFNLRMAKFIKENNIKTLFYISPKVWAWKKSRIKKVKAYIDFLYLILPFEKEFYKKNGFESTYYIGNPLSDAIDTFEKGNKRSREEFGKEWNLDKKPIIACLAGSRKQEIVRLLPVMLKNSEYFSDYQFVVAGAPSISAELYSKLMKGHSIPVVNDQTYELLRHSHAAIVTSGTATLETALFKVPQVVLYKFNSLSFIIFKPFIWIKYFSLVNIILEKPVVKEFLQFGLIRKTKLELLKILYEPEYYKTMLEEYKILGELVGGPGSSQRAAEHMYNLLTEKN
jgi:lipid-A-disaccharide synthase